jgi:hypothetical protein
VNPVVATTLDRIRRNLGTTMAAVYLREPDQLELRLAGFAAAGGGGVPAHARQYAWGKGLPGAAAEQADVVTAPEPDPYAVAVPLLLGDEAVGALAVARDGGRGFTITEADALLAEGQDLARALAPPPLDALRAELERRLAAPALAWCETVIAAARRGDRESIVIAFPAAGRRAGREPLGARGALVRRDPDIEVPLRAWRIDDAVRVAFLAAFTGDAEALARDLYLTGDLRERAGALRGLAVIGRGTAALDVVLDACRVTAAELFEAALAENPYVSRVLPDGEFRTAVLKCAFVGVAIDRVADVERRADAELSRMLLSYVSEREVAGRSVPPDLWPVVARHPTPGLAGKLIGYLEHPAEAHRIAAARALGRIGDERARPFLLDRLARESDPAVRRALERAVARH